jgi:site-specific recombinase XerD
MQEYLVPFPGGDARVAELLSKAHALASHAAPNTLRSYLGDWQDFCEFASSIGASALPAEPSTVACYLAARAGELKAATLGRRLSGIAFYHRRARVDSPTRHPQVRAVLKGIKREYGAAQTFKRALLTPEIRRIVACCPDTLAGVRDRALWLVSFAAMTRRSETAALRVEDVTASEPDGIVLNIRKSKVDAESHGRTVGIPYGDDEATCPILALRSYLAAAKITSGAVFRAVDQKGRVSDRGLHPDSIGYIFKRTAARAGMQCIDEVAGHSTRSGAISQSIASGVDPFVVRKQSGHKADSRSFERYVRVGEMFTRNAAAGLGL